MGYGRFCENCGSKMPPFFPRQQDEEGNLVCSTCKGTRISAQARAIIHFARDNNIKLAHDSGDGETLYHCPFCGAGQLVGRSDGTAECGFCGTAFTVQVQPQQSAMPQTIDGEPVKMPDMPGDDPGEPEVDEEAGTEETDLGDDGETDMDDFGQDPAETANPFEPKVKANPFQSFKTSQGAVLTEEDYIRHLAIRHAENRDRVIAKVRSDKEG